MPEILHPVVREQLDALDFQRVLWQGEVWPRQHAELEIREEARAREQEQAGESVWHSTLNIDLPGLGPVTAQIMLSPEGAHINMRANASAIAALRANGAEFQAAMRDAGISLRQLDMNEERDDG
jgi:transposase